jgi:hypothetical protein
MIGSIGFQITRRKTNGKAQETSNKPAQKAIRNSLDFRKSLACVLEASAKKKVFKMKLVLAAGLAWVFLEGINSIADRNMPLASVTLIVLVVLGSGYIAEKLQK